MSPHSPEAEALALPLRAAARSRGRLSDDRARLRRFEPLAQRSARERARERSRGARGGARR